MIKKAASTTSNTNCLNRILSLFARAYPRFALGLQQRNVYVAVPCHLLRYTLFPFYGGGGFGGDVVDNTINASYFIHNARGDFFQ